MEKKGSKYDKSYFDEKHEGHPEDRTAAVASPANNDRNSGAKTTDSSVTRLKSPAAPVFDKSTLDKLVGVRCLMQMKLKSQALPSKPGTFANQEWFLKFASKEEATLIKRVSTTESYGISHGKTYTFGSLSDIEWVKEAQ